MVSVIGNLKTVAGGHAAHKRQADHGSHFPYIFMENEKELTPRGAWQ